jgi:hypothetical protein
MVRIRSIGVMSVAKIYGILNMAIGILISFFLVLFGLVGLAVVPGQQKLGMAGFLVLAALAPFFYGAVGFVVGAIGALLYNWIASAVGGIELDLEAVPSAYIAQPPAANSPV